MPVKHWSFAGLLLTYWCNARCASCYVCSSPQCTGDMAVEDGLALWEGLVCASPHGCRIHLSGGEPFGRWEALIALARAAGREGLGPLEAVETNAFWATDEKDVRDRLGALDDAGMGRLTVSADPYHQQFVPIERVRLAARVGEEALGARRVQVRWRDWAAAGYDTSCLEPLRRWELFARYAAIGRDRLVGRAAVELAGLLQLRPASVFADSPCGDRLLRCRHVHVDAAGTVCPGTCAGIVLGRAGKASTIGQIWRRLADRFADMDEMAAAGSPDEQGGEDVLAILVQAGPGGLMKLAQGEGYTIRSAGYAGKCHLCWDVRRWLFDNGFFPGQLGPECVYRPEALALE